MSSEHKGGGAAGIGAGDVLGIVFVVLKLLGVITWSWWWVLAPFWVPVVLVIILLLILWLLK